MDRSLPKVRFDGSFVFPKSSQNSPLHSKDHVSDVDFIAYITQQFFLFHFDLIVCLQMEPKYVGKHRFYQDWLW